MDEQEALRNMVRPGARKPGKWLDGVIQVWLTRACDKACFHCTQASNLGGNPGMITLENFEKACISLKDYHGVIGIFGGNPALHPKFEEICAILEKHIPWRRRGLWCNHPKGKGQTMRRVFNPGVSNLNVHLDQEAYDEFKKWWPECNPCGLDTDSRHAPVHGSMIELGVSEAERWAKISQCDINRHWSGMFGQFRGELRFWFCEIAGAQAMLRQHLPDYPDTGFDADYSVNHIKCWNLPMQEYAAQVRQHCHRCLVPMRGHGELAQNTTGVETTTRDMVELYKTKDRLRRVEVAASPIELTVDNHNVVSYLEHGRKQ